MRSLARIVSIVAVIGGTACDDRTVPIRPGERTSLQPDLGTVADAAFDRPVRGLCVPGSRRCVTENSPLFETCGGDGGSFRRGACTDGEVCREGACTPFSCVVGRPLCIGATTSAVCDASGAAVRDAVGCEEPQVCVGGACTDLCESARQARSYITCDYTAIELPNLYQDIEPEEPSPYAIVVANPAVLVDARVTITDGDDPAGLREPFSLTPGPNFTVGAVTDLESVVLLADGSTSPILRADNVTVPPGAAAVFMVQGSGHYQVKSTRPVVAYQFSPYCCNFTATNDASLLLPVSSWGTRYRVLGYPAWRLNDREPWQQAYVEVVARVDTVLKVESPVPLATETQSGTSFEVALVANEPVRIATTAIPTDTPESLNTDLTGAVLTADDPIGVFTGHPCTFVPWDQWACDHLEEALLPADILGQRYVLTPVRRRSVDDTDAIGRDIREATYWRIVADETTQLTFNPPLDELDVLEPSNPSSPSCLDVASLQEGEFCEFGTRQPTTLAGTGAMMVGGIISGHQSTGVAVYGTQAGDPSLFILPPVEQFRASYAFVSPPTFLRTYVTVAAPPSVAITLDGRSVPETQRLERRLVDLGGASWEVFTIAIEPGVHTMQSDTRFGIVAYAYDDYVSYAFTGGLDLVPKGN